MLRCRYILGIHAEMKHGVVHQRCQRANLFLSVGKNKRYTKNSFFLEIALVFKTK